MMPAAPLCSIRLGDTRTPAIQALKAFGGLRRTLLKSSARICCNAWIRTIEFSFVSYIVVPIRDSLASPFGTGSTLGCKCIGAVDRNGGADSYLTALEVLALRNLGINDCCCWKKAQRNKALPNTVWSYALRSMVGVFVPLRCPGRATATHHESNILTICCISERRRTVGLTTAASLCRS